MNTAFYFLWMAAWLALATLIFSFAPGLKSKFDLRSPMSLAADPRFNGPLDSLRGFLAASVIFHHACILLNYWQTNRWGFPPSHFYGLLGSVAVTLFFILSGYLFWSKALIDQGLPSLKRFFSARFRRILPAYYALALLLFIFAFATQSFQLKESIAELARDTTSWITVGVFPNFHIINQVTTTLIACADVVWTLRFEMMFYLAMPVLALLATKRRMWLIVVGSIAIDIFATRMTAAAPARLIIVFCDFNHFFAIGFGFGFICAFLEQTLPERARTLMRRREFSVLAFLILILTFVLPIEPHSYGQSILLSLFFLLIVARNDLFGLLRLPASQWLGKISYDIYLFHGFVLFITSLAITTYVKPFATLSPIEFWSYVGFCGFITLILSSLVHLYIERPFARHRPRTLAPKSHPI